MQAFNSTRPKIHTSVTSHNISYVNLNIYLKHSVLNKTPLFKVESMYPHFWRLFYLKFFKSL